MRKFRPGDKFTVKPGSWPVNRETVRNRHLPFWILDNLYQANSENFAMMRKGDHVEGFYESRLGVDFILANKPTIII